MDYPSEEYSEGEGYEGFMSEEGDYAFTFADISRVSSGIVYSTKKEAFLSPLDAQLFKVDMALKDFISMGFHEGETENARKLVETISAERLLLLNADLLATASLFIIKYSVLDRDNFSKFVKESKGLDFVNHLDVVRYVQILKTI